MAAEKTPPPLHAVPRLALPSHLLNGHSPLRQTTSTSNRAQERERLASSIQSTYRRRTSIDPSELNRPVNNGRSWNGMSNGDIQEDVTSFNANSSTQEADASKSHLEEAPPRDLRDSAPPTQSASASRPASPYTLNPPIDFDGLSWPSLGTRARLDQSPEQAQERLDKLSGAVRTILECLGEDPDREGLAETPLRYAKALMYFTKGYEENVRDLVNGAVFHEDHDELVIVRDIEVFSLCEHHLVPFMGKMHIGYIPNRRVLGLSKLARLAEMFSRRLQVQERLTKQVALAVAEVLKPQGVAVVMESSHLCMVMRGVQKTTSSTTTSCMLGAMRSSAKTREEFLSLLNRGR